MHVSVIVIFGGRVDFEIARGNCLNAAGCIRPDRTERKGATRGRARNQNWKHTDNQQGKNLLFQFRGFASCSPFPRAVTKASRAGFHNGDNVPQFPNR
jgi:hypothetical protein